MGMRSNLKNSHSKDIKDQLNDWYPTLNFDIVLKCWRRMNQCLDYDHCGAHTDHVKDCIKSHKFRTLMHECREQAESLWASGQNSISVICISDQGRHRSVAVSSVLQAAYLLCGRDSYGPYHMSGGQWWSGICHTCKDCQPNAYKDGLVTGLASSGVVLSTPAR